MREWISPNTTETALSADASSIAAPSPAPSWGGFFRRWLKPIVFVASLLPLAWLFYRALNNDLGANPIEAIIRYLGDWALRFMLIALAVTPVRMLTGWLVVARLRRMLGLYAFFYVILHVMGYVALDHFFDWMVIWRDIVKRVYITVGMAALVMLVPLAVTSTDGMIRRLGGAAWRRLHLLVYPAAIAGIIHYALMIKAGYQEPLLYAAILTVLFGIRLYKKFA
jgi:sulfoxide reductase heme-binding subunit YedZ